MVKKHLQAKVLYVYSALWGLGFCVVRDGKCMLHTLATLLCLLDLDDSWRFGS